MYTWRDFQQDLLQAKNSVECPYCGKILGIGDKSLKIHDGDEYGYAVYSFNCCGYRIGFKKDKDFTISKIGMFSQCFKEPPNKTVIKKNSITSYWGRIYYLMMDVIEKGTIENL